MENDVYLVTMVAVYDHGCAGIFTTKEAAIAHAEKLFADSDKHHNFRIDTIRVNDPIDIAARGKPGKYERNYHQCAWCED